jgi:DNA-binding NtrC family response regulator
MANILVLDDELDAVLFVKRALQSEGHKVSVFTEEEEAIAFAVASPVDLAILDIHLKKMNGIEVLEVLKKINPSMRAMILTGYPTPETARKAVELGVEEYCTKPIEIQQIEWKVASILGSGSKTEDGEERLR